MTPSLAYEAWLLRRFNHPTARPYWRGKVRWIIARNLRSDSAKGKGNKAWRRVDAMQRAERAVTITQADLFQGIL